MKKKIEDSVSLTIISEAVKAVKKLNREIIVTNVHIKPNNLDAFKNEHKHTHHFI